MPQIPLTAGNYGRDRLALPTTRLVNAYIEASPGGPEQAVRTARPGLTTLYDLGNGPVLRNYQQPGLFLGDVFTVSGSGFYRADTQLGTVAFSQNPRMAAANGQLALVVGGALYIYNGTTFLPQLFFDDGVSLLPPFSGVAVLYDIFIYPVVGSNQFFFSSVGSPGVINAANFSQAQTSPTPIVEVAVLAEELYFFKSANGIEIWDYTGALTAPFALSQGRTYARGCISQGSVVGPLDNALFWIGDDLTVYRTGIVPQRISTSTIEDRLKAVPANVAGGIYAFGINGIEGHVFYIVNLPDVNESYAYDCQTKEWAQWGTQGGAAPQPEAMVVQTCVGQGNQIYLGSRGDGILFTLDAANRKDGATPIVVEVDGALWRQGGVTRCLNVTLHCVRGAGTPDTPRPIVQMCFSDDGGRTFSSWLQGLIGMIGQYRYKAVWRSLGYFKQPGRLFRWRISDPVIVAVEGAAYNIARP